MNKITNNNVLGHMLEEADSYIEYGLSESETGFGSIYTPITYEINKIKLELINDIVLKYGNFDIACLSVFSGFYIHIDVLDFLSEIIGCRRNQFFKMVEGEKIKSEVFFKKIACLYERYKVELKLC